jgi:hypothetical protein
MCRLRAAGTRAADQCCSHVCGQRYLQPSVQVVLIVACHRAELLQDQCSRPFYRWQDQTCTRTPHLDRVRDLAKIRSQLAVVPGFTAPSLLVEYSAYSPAHVAAYPG